MGAVSERPRTLSTKVPDAHMARVALPGALSALSRANRARLLLGLRARLRARRLALPGVRSAAARRALSPHDGCLVCRRARRSLSLCAAARSAVASPQVPRHTPARPGVGAFAGGGARAAERFRRCAHSSATPQGAPTQARLQPGRRDCADHRRGARHPAPRAGDSPRQSDSGANDARACGPQHERPRRLRGRPRLHGPLRRTRRRCHYDRGHDQRARRGRAGGGCLRRERLGNRPNTGARAPARSGRVLSSGRNSRTGCRRTRPYRARRCSRMHESTLRGHGS